MRIMKVRVADEVYEYFDVARRETGIPMSKLVEDALKQFVEGTRAGALVSIFQEIKCAEKG